MMYINEWSFKTSDGHTIMGRCAHEDQRKCESMTRKAVFARRKEIGPRAAIKNGASKADWGRTTK
jgi:hypothetical protein